MVGKTSAAAIVRGVGGLVAISLKALSERAQCERAFSISISSICENGDVFFQVFPYVLLFLLMISVYVGQRLQKKTIMGVARLNAEAEAIIVTKAE